MKKNILFFIFIVFSSLVFSQEKNIEDKNSNSSANKSEQVTAIKIAQHLANYAYENSDALSMLSAAKILVKNIPFEMNPDSVKQVKISANKKSKKIANTLKPLTLINDAKKMTDDKNLLEIASNIEKKIKAFEGRGTAEGAKASYKIVAGNSHIDYWITFLGGTVAEIAVVGDGDTDLDLFIYDENENLIIKSVSYGDNCYVSWRPRWTGSFKVKIENRGKKENKFLIATN